MRQMFVSMFVVLGVRLGSDVVGTLCVCIYDYCVYMAIVQFLCVQSDLYFLDHIEPLIKIKSTNMIIRQ